MITLLIVILHDLDKLPKLLEAWKKANVPGVTILQSAGGFHAETLVKRGGLSGLLKLFEHDNGQQRLLFCLIDDPEILQVAIAEADRVVGGFDRPHSGILFTLPVGEALGLQKWEQRDNLEDISLEDIPDTDKGAENLSRWLEKEIEEQHGRKALKDWKAKRNKNIQAAIKQVDLKPIVVHVDTPLNEVVKQFVANPRLSLACVINQEDRLVGLIEEKQLGKMMLIPAMPDQFIQDPEGYEQALKYAKIKPNWPAADVMSETAFVVETGTLEEAYIAMRSRKLEALPVVNKHYYVTGYITLKGVLSVFFGE